MSSIKPTILYLIDTLQTGGAEKSLLEITSRFQRFTPIFVTLFAGKHDLLPEYKSAGIKVIRLGFPVSNRFGEMASKVDKLVQEHQAVIVHSSIFRSDMVARNLKSKVKIVNSLINNNYNKRRYKELNLFGKLSLMRVLLWDKVTQHRVDLTISNSQVLVGFYLKTIGLDPRKTVVIHRGRPIPSLGSQLGTGKVEPGRDFVNRNSKIVSRTWLCVGRLIERKGHKDLLPAFAKLLKSRPNDRLVLAGDGEYRNEVEKMIKQLGIENHVQVLGTVKNVSELLTEADFFVFPSYFEGLPGALIEAMMAKVPIICSDIPENQECVDDLMCLFHRVGDQLDLLSQMEKALVLTEWQERTQRAYDYAVEYFEINKISKKYEETYLKLLNSCVE